MEKVIRDGKVAVLCSPGFGAGWSTWADAEISETLVFEPEVVKMVEENRMDEIEDYIENKYEKFHVYCGGADDLEIVWVPEGTEFQIREYDGSESIWFKNDSVWMVA